MSSSSKSAESILAVDSAHGEADSRGWIEDARSLIEANEVGETQLYQSLSSLLASVTDASAGLIYDVPETGKPVCAGTTVFEGIPPSIGESPEISSIVLAASQSESMVRGSPGGNTPKNQFSIAGLSDGRGTVFVVILGSQSPKGNPELTRLIQIPMAVLQFCRDREKFSKYETGFQRASILLEMLNRAGKIQQFQLAMSMIADESMHFAGCEKVAIGIGDKNNCKVRALTGQHHIDRLSHPCTLLRNFMREAIAVDRSIAWPPIPSLANTLQIAGNADELLEAFQADAVTATPLKIEDGDQIGAWICLWTGEQKQALEENWNLVEALAPHLAAVTQLVVAGKPRGLRRLINFVFARNRWKRRLLIFLLLAAFTAAMFVRIPYPVTVDCWLESKVTREVAAPFEGVLEKSMVRRGDYVEEGQILATLDGKEIGWRLSELKAQKEVAIRQIDQALATDDISAAQLSELELKSAQLEVDILEHRQENLEIKSPISGLVMSGDLAQSQGVPVRLGQKLFDIALIETLQVHLAVPDLDFSHVRKGMKVKMRLEFQVDYEFEMELLELHPASKTVDGKNVFIGIAEVQNESGRLRPGMRGQARIYSDTKSLGWILFHKPWDFIRLNLWV